MVKIVRLVDAFSEIFELEAISRVRGGQSLQQKYKLRNENKRRKQNEKKSPEA